MDATNHNRYNIPILNGQDDFKQWDYLIETHTESIDWHITPGRPETVSMADIIFGRISNPHNDTIANKLNKPTDIFTQATIKQESGNMTANATASTSTSTGNKITTELYDRINYKAKSFLIAHISTKVQNELGRFQYASDMYAKLKQMYANSSVAAVGMVKKQVYTCKLNDDESARQYATRLSNLIDHHNRISDSLITQQDAAYVLKDGLNSKYDALLPILNRIPRESFTFDEITSQIVQWDLEHPIRDTPITSDVAMYTKHQFHKDKPQYDKSQSRYTHKTDADGVPVCNYCEKHGHRWAQCRSRLRDKNNNEDKAVSLLVTQKAMNVSNTQLQNKIASFVVDSGSSQHIVGDKNMLYDFEESTSEFIGFNNDTVMSAGTGKMKIRFNSKNDWLVLYNVAYVPNANNILSVNKLVCNKYKVDMNNDCATIISIETKKQLCEANWINNCYKVVAYLHCYGRSTARALCMHTSSDNSILWHQRLGHINYQYINKMQRLNAVIGLDNPIVEPLTECSDCIHGKMQRKRYLYAENRATRPLELIHSDIGQFDKHSNYCKYYITFIDDYSRYCWIYIVNSTNNFLNYWKQFQNMVERQYPTYKISALRSDNGVQYINDDMREYLKAQGIREERTPAYSPDSNGVAENKNKQLKNMVRTMLCAAKLGDEWWYWALDTAVYIWNRVVGKATFNKTPYELIHPQQRKPSYKHFRRFGCLARVLNQTSNIKALADRAIDCMFIGYCGTTKQWLVYNPLTKKVMKTKQVVFDESVMADKINLTKMDTQVRVAAPILDKQIEVVDCSIDSVGENIVESATQSTVQNNTTEPVDTTEQQNSDNTSNGTESTESIQDAVVQVATEHLLPLLETDTPPTTPIKSPTDKTTEINVSTEPNTVHESDALEQSNDVDDTIKSVIKYNMRNNTYWVEYNNGKSGWMKATDLRGTDKDGDWIVDALQTYLNLQQSKKIRSSTRTQQKAMLIQSDNIKIPNTFSEAEQSFESPEWITACNTEMQAHAQNKTGEIVECPPHIKPIKIRWIFSIKSDPFTYGMMFKARTVAKGYEQIDGVNYDSSQLFAAPFRIKLMKLILIIVATNDLELHQLDVKTAFLNAPLKEDVYVELPDGYKEYKNNVELVWKLNKALYGLKQAPRAWYDTCDDVLQNKLGFTRTTVEYGLYKYIKDDVYCLIPLYVDDMLIACNSIEFVTNVKSIICNEWKCKDLGEAKSILGLNIERDRSKKLIYLHQQPYIDKILHTLELDPERLKHKDTPASDNVVLNELMCPTADSERMEMKEIPYRSVVGELLYLLHTRPDIEFAVHQVCKYMHNPGKQHWMAVKHILRYLAKTKHYKLIIDGNCELTLSAYTDADYGTCTDSRKCISGMIIYLGKTPIAWKTKQQRVVAQSTAEAEYISMAQGTKDIIYFRSMCTELGIPQTRPTVLYGDNNSAICLTSNPDHHELTKHISNKYHFIRDCVIKQIIKCVYIPTEQMRADIMTKALSTSKHQHYIKYLSLNN
jgi:transposase InsO family protein